MFAASLCDVTFTKTSMTSAVDVIALP